MEKDAFIYISKARMATTFSQDGCKNLVSESMIATACGWGKFMLVSYSNITKHKLINNVEKVFSFAWIFKRSNESTRGFVYNLNRTVKKFYLPTESLVRVRNVINETFL